MRKVEELVRKLEEAQWAQRQAASDIREIAETIRFNRSQKVLLNSIATRLENHADLLGTYLCDDRINLLEIGDAARLSRRTILPLMGKGLMVLAALATIGDSGMSIIERTQESVNAADKSACRVIVLTDEMLGRGDSEPRDGRSPEEYRELMRQQLRWEIEGDLLSYSGESNALAALAWENGDLFDEVSERITKSVAEYRDCFGEDDWYDECQLHGWIPDEPWIPQAEDAPDS